MTDAAPLDPRICAYRPDLADASLQTQVKADSFVNPQMRQCVRGVVPLLKEPKADSLHVSEIRYGEFLDVFEKRADGFAWVQNRTDRYVGYIETDHVLGEQISDLSSRIRVLHTYVYEEPHLKARVVDHLTLGSYVQIFPAENGFVKLASGGFIFAKHVGSTEETKERDYVFTAGRLLGAPYLCGGRTPLGIDCSGLVQLSLELAGFDCPRDSDQQHAVWGQKLPTHWRDVDWRRGDLVFFEGHVGIMVSHSHLINANGFSMLVTIDPLVDLVLQGRTIKGMGRPA